MGSNPILGNLLYYLSLNMFKKLKQNHFIYTNQLRSKLLIKNNRILEIKTIQLHLNLNNLKSFNETTILEGLFLLEFITSLKAAISSYKKMYQQVNIQLMIKLRKNYVFYFLNLLKIFYFPIILRRNEIVTYNFNQSLTFSFTIDNLNILPFLSDVFFK